MKFPLPRTANFATNARTCRNDLVKAVANVNSNVIVVVHSVGPIILETILAQPNVKAVVWAGIPGQESGNGLVDVLYGSTSPSGKLPYTIAKQASDYGTTVVSGDDSYQEGLFIDYRHFDNVAITPRYEFGYGLCKSSLPYSLSSHLTHTSQPTPHSPTPPSNSPRVAVRPLTSTPSPPSPRPSPTTAPWPEQRSHSSTSACHTRPLLRRRNS